MAAGLEAPDLLPSLGPKLLTLIEEEPTEKKEKGGQPGPRMELRGGRFPQVG